MAFTIFGSKTPKVCIYKSESQKLRQAFQPHVTSGTVDTIEVGQPVYLETDGTIKPMATDTPVYKYLGIAETNTSNPCYGVDNNIALEVTVALRGFMILYGSASAAISTTGAVKPTGAVDSDGRAIFAPVVSPNASVRFLNLTTAAAEGDLIQVLVLD